MLKLYVLCGIPGAGKSTAAYNIDPEAKVHSYDDIIGANSGKKSFRRVGNTWFENMRNDLLAGYNVVCDSTNLTVKSRQHVLNQFKDIECEKDLVVLATPIEECMRRNEGRKRKVPNFVITQSAKLFEAPTDDEGWDNIFLWENDSL